ncbi:hypothetical protein DDE18_21060 [Nocardioides gansuensis]|uniref:Gp5/Type VI secretion system Vgr protein OB-fold domain-containing protein n=1 Tax=Nocardioides gansuensis TaxID=2138300 RepID=A0A2T8F571_9ACTN|nr:phage baseplate assembly protein V [Nocardioides gansuensis]PVG80874.1 hypothetical protein DDE18_21060 [Nocardioides gansuensis]
MGEIIYLMDRDPGTTGYFHEAEGYFSARPDSTVVPTAAGDPATTLQDVFKDLRARARTDDIFPVINLVSHATGFSSLEFPISDARRDKDGGLITKETLKAALASPGSGGYPAVLGPPAVTKATKVVLYGCDVGRDEEFMKLLGQLFGPELTIYAPVRVAVFRHTGTLFEHRLARTWAANHTSDITKTTNWAPVRTAFVTKAVTKFKPRGGAEVEAAIKAAAQTATAVQAKTFFFSESLSTGDDPVATSVSGSSAVLPSGTTDDTTVPITVGPTDFAKQPGQPPTWVAWVAVLGQVIEEEVSISNRSQFRETVIKPQKAASVNPLVPQPDLEPNPIDPDEENTMAFFGKYRGTVVDAADPLGEGRLQVEVPVASVTAEWAAACLPPVPQALLRLPEVGASVWVEFEGGDVLKPIWTGATWDDAAAGGLSLESEDELTLRSVGNLLQESSGGQMIRSGADLTLECGGTLTLKAGNVRVESSTADHTGILKSDQLITNSVVASSYTPGAGNVW